MCRVHVGRLRRGHGCSPGLRGSNGADGRHAHQALPPDQMAVHRAPVDHGEITFTQLTPHPHTVPPASGPPHALQFQDGPTRRLNQNTQTGDTARFDFQCIKIYEGFVYLHYTEQLKTLLFRYSVKTAVYIVFFFFRRGFRLQIILKKIMYELSCQDRVINGYEVRFSSESIEDVIRQPLCNPGL